MICLLDVAERGGEKVHWLEDSNKERKERLSIRVNKRNTQFIHPHYTQFHLSFIQQTLHHQSRFALAFAIDLISFFSFRSFFLTYASRNVPTHIKGYHRLFLLHPLASLNLHRPTAAQLSVHFLHRFHSLQSIGEGYKAVSSRASVAFALDNATHRKRGILHSEEIRQYFGGHFTA